MNYVTVNNGKFIQNGHEILLFGCNMYGLGKVSDKQAAEMMADAKEEGFEAVRFWAFEPTDKNHFEYICNNANKFDLMLIPVIADKWGFLQNYKINNQWYITGYKKSYLKYAIDIVRSFKDREEIIIWEIINEPVTSSFDSIFNFTRHVTEELKNISSSHLFSIGTVGGIGDKFGGPLSIFNFNNFKKLYSLPGLDAISIHDYSYDSTLLERLHVYFTLAGKQRAAKFFGYADSFINTIPNAVDKFWIKKTGNTLDFPFGVKKIWRRYNNYAVELAKQLNKPIYAGEVGFKRKQGELRNHIIEMDFKQKIQQGYSGYLLWSYESTGASYDAHGYGIKVGEVKDLLTKLKKIRAEIVAQWDRDKIKSFLKNIKSWAIEEKNIIAAILIGSQANYSAREDSDVDIVIIAERPDAYLQNREWINRFGDAEKIGDEDWELVKTVRVFYNNSMEVEYNFTTAEWANTNPVDKETKKIIEGGYRVIYDKHDIISSLIKAIKSY